MTWIEWVPFGVGLAGMAVIVIAIVVRERRTRLRADDEVPYHDEDVRVAYDSKLAQSNATQPYLPGGGPGGRF